MARTPISNTEHDLLRTVRDARFASGRVCVHCGSRRIQRWGTFSGRQRYRCVDCRRTSSDLTGSVLARTKRLRCWPEFLNCWQDSRTVRLTAQLACVHPSTAFRWRHRLCDFLRCAEEPVLRGFTEAMEVRFAYSRKGERGVRSLQSRTMAEQRRRRRVSVVILCDRSGGAAGDIVGGARPVIGELRGLYSETMHPDAVLLSAYGRLAPVAAAARALRLSHTRVKPTERDPLFHLENAWRHVRHLRVWLERFRGVATRYLSNYLSWYRQLEPLQADTATTRLLARCCGPGCQQSPRTEPDEAAWVFTGGHSRVHGFAGYSPNRHPQDAFPATGA